jgi:hypothetical protein
MSESEKERDRLIEAARMVKEGVTRCSCGRFYKLEDLPEKCECGVELFGRWARANRAALKAAREAAKAKPVDPLTRLAQEYDD